MQVILGQWIDRLSLVLMIFDIERFISLYPIYDHLDQHVVKSSISLAYPATLRIIILQNWIRYSIFESSIFQYSNLV